MSHFGELRGLKNLDTKRRIELVPYAVGRAERFAAEAGNPFRDGSAADFDGGIDGKIGLTDNLTINFTVNPDFGQVEADPSEVNLSEFETFFAERRPFFVEGNDIFDMRLAPAVTGGPFTNDRLFYSRRIGRRPATIRCAKRSEKLSLRGVERGVATLRDSTDVVARADPFSRTEELE